MSHHAAIARSPLKTAAVTRRMVDAVAALVSGGNGIDVSVSKTKKQPSARKPAKIRIETRAHGRRRISPTPVQIPRTPEAAIIKKPAIAVGTAAPGGRADDGAMKSAATPAAGTSSAKVLPRNTTMALAITPAGRFMGDNLRLSSQPYFVGFGLSLAPVRAGTDRTRHTFPRRHHESAARTRSAHVDGDQDLYARATWGHRDDLHSRSDFRSSRTGDRRSEGLIIGALRETPRPGRHPDPGVDLRHRRRGAVAGEHHRDLSRRRHPETPAGDATPAVDDSLRSRDGEAVADGADHDADGGRRQKILLDRPRSAAGEIHHCAPGKHAQHTVAWLRHRERDSHGEIRAAHWRGHLLPN